MRTKRQGDYNMASNSKEVQREADERRADWRARAWTCVVYPDSAPKDWMDILHSQGIAYDISPLHDKDKNAEGEYKKHHYHVVLDWGAGATTSGTRAIEIFDLIGAVYPDPKKDRREFLKCCKVKKLVSALRYLCHLDEHDPDKTKYDVAGVRSGFEEMPYCERVMKAMEKDEMTMTMVHFVVEQGISDFATFVLQAEKEHPEWMHAIINDKPGTFVNRFINGIASQQRLKKDSDQREIQHRRFLLECRTWEECSQNSLDLEFVAPYDEHLEPNELGWYTK